MSANLSKLGEQGLLHLLTGKWRPLSRQVLTGVGDDCAVLRGSGPGHYLLLKTDAVVEDVHFTKRTPPAAIGRKALARALSDIAAMGGKPLAGLITLGFPVEESPRRLRGIYQGLEKTAREFKTDLVGGETTRAKQLFLSIALLGECRGHRPVMRSGAKPRDILFVTGKLGGSRRGHHFKFLPRLAEGEWLARENFAAAMMDLSDGLGADLPRLARASHCSYTLEQEAVPRRAGCGIEEAMNDGEDYELLFTVKPAKIEALKKSWPFVTPLHAIGVMTAAGARLRNFKHHGFDHFKQP